MGNTEFWDKPLGIVSMTLDESNNHEDLLQRLDQINAIGIALSAEKDNDKLLEQILLGAKQLTNADGGTLYSLTEEEDVTQRRLRFEIMRTDSLGIAMGGTTGKPIPIPPIPLYDPQGKPVLDKVVTNSVIRNTTINIPDAYQAKDFDFTGTRAFDEKMKYRSTSFLTIPMKNHENDIIGVLQLLNARDRKTGEIVPFSKHDQMLAESLASQAAVAWTNKRLIDELKHLFNSLVKLIADSIDGKSPYTGGHCKRVPIVTMALAEAAIRADEGTFKDFTLNPDELYELETAAWLHDCGKISTPEYVMDKATKLETIYDRVYAVDSRFEVLKRDLEIEKLKAILQARERQEDTTPIEQEYQEKLAILNQEQDFIRRSNTGGEFMKPEDQERVRRISKRYYTQSDGKEIRLLNCNEVYNLIINRGTLNQEEREVINNHVTMTIKMLKSLPFPKSLKHVVEYAGGHHEQLNGKGYPYGLKGDQLSMQARIIALADIFEALTASDRPYKKAKTLSEAMKIMGFMVKDQHIDPDLFALFVKEKLYLNYANEYLRSDQLDEVDISKIPALNPPPSQPASEKPS